MTTIDDYTQEEELNKKVLKTHDAEDRLSSHTPPHDPLTPKQQRVKKFVEYMQNYWNTYDKQHNYLDYDDNTLLNDALYGLGVALDDKHQWRPGYDEFKKFLRTEFLKPDAVSWNEQSTDGKVF